MSPLFAHGIFSFVEMITLPHVICFDHTNTIVEEEIFFQLRPDSTN